jgi:hypothetical protein
LRRTPTRLSVGKVAALVAYSLTVVALLLSVDAPKSTPHFVDDVAFRAAWVTVTQIPLVFLLSSKHGFLNVLANVSYERVSYLHRWAGRMIFVSATTHVVIMKSSISIMDILFSQDKGATVVRYGIGSYFLLIWIAFSSIFPVRRWSYRAFYINHWISTLAFLMLVIQHVPKHAMTPIYVAFGFVAIDKTSTLVLFARTNVSVRPMKSRLAKFRRGPGRARLIAGFQVEMLEPHILSASAEIVESATTIRICNVPLQWRPGQHIRLYLPAMGAFELHPFTPANCPSIAVPPPLPPRRSEDLERQGSPSSMPPSRQSSDILLMIRAHEGLTQRLKNFHTEWLSLPCPNATISPTTTLTAYVDGPYGTPPSWESCENLILVVTSTGVSFALSILDYLEQLCLSNESEMRTQVIRFVWTVRHIDPQFEATVAEMLRRFSTILKDSGVRIETELYVTCQEAELETTVLQVDQFAHLRPRLPRYGSGDRSLTIRNPDEIYDEWEEEERQWAEMEALEESQMHQVDPFEDENEVSSVCCDDDATARGYDGEGYASSECSTLLDGTDEQRERSHSNTCAEVRLTVDETTALTHSRSSLSPPVCSPLQPRHDMRKKKTCECALIQYQREKLHSSRRPLFDSSSYGRRPDISCIVTSALSSDQYSNSMVAVCANDAVSRHARIAVSQAKIAFARGQRATDVDMFLEGLT